MSRTAPTASTLTNSEIRLLTAISTITAKGAVLDTRGDAPIKIGDVAMTFSMEDGVSPWVLRAWLGGDYDTGELISFGYIKELPGPVDHLPWPNEFWLRHSDSESTHVRFIDPSKTNVFCEAGKWVGSFVRAGNPVLSLTDSGRRLLLRVAQASDAVEAAAVSGDAGGEQCVEGDSDAAPEQTAKAGAIAHVYRKRKRLIDPSGLERLNSIPPLPSKEPEKHGWMKQVAAAGELVEKAGKNREDSEAVKAKIHALRVARGDGIHDKEKTCGVDNAGNKWRQDPTTKTTIWYLQSSLSTSGRGQ